jgi:hypothetical protein
MPWSPAPTTRDDGHRSTAPTSSRRSLACSGVTGRSISGSLSPTGSRTGGCRPTRRTLRRRLHDRVQIPPLIANPFGVRRLPALSIAPSPAWGKNANSPSSVSPPCGQASRVPGFPLGDGLAPSHWTSRRVPETAPHPRRDVSPSRPGLACIPGSAHPNWRPAPNREGECPHEPPGTVPQAGRTVPSPIY